VLDFALQDVAERLKRALRLRAVVGLKLDNTLIPVVQGMDADKDPYRTVPATWSWPFSTTGDATHLGVTHVDNLLASIGVVVITRLRLWTTTATTQAQWGVLRPTTSFSAGVALTQACNVPFVSPGGGIVNARPPLARFGQDPANSTLPALLGQALLTLNVPQDIILKNPIVLFPNDAFVLVSGANTQNVSGYVEGEDYFPLP
jgi:hypothetical protein